MEAWKRLDTQLQWVVLVSKASSLTLYRHPGRDVQVMVFKYCMGRQYQERLDKRK